MRDKSPHAVGAKSAVDRRGLIEIGDSERMVGVFRQKRALDDFAAMTQSTGRCDGSKIEVRPWESKSGISSHGC